MRLVRTTWLLSALAILAGSTFVGADITPGATSSQCDANLTLDAQCGGHGVCSPVTQTCACDPNWSTLADFVAFESCDTSIIAMYILWALNLVEIAYILYKCMWVIVLRFEIFWENRATSGIWKNKGLMGIMAWLFICIPFQAIMAFAHMADPTMRVGFSVLATLCFFFAKLGLYLGSLLLQGPFLSAALKSEIRFRRTIKVNYFFSFLISCMSIVVGSIAFVTYVHFQNDFEAQVRTIRIYYYLQGLALIFNATQALLVLRHVLYVLNIAKEIVATRDKSATIKKKVSDFQRGIIIQGYLQGVIYMLLGSLPFFWNKHQYFLPISWLAMPILGKNLVFQFDVDGHKGRSIRERLGLKVSTTTREPNSTSKKRVGASPGGGSYDSQQKEKIKSGDTIAVTSLQQMDAPSGTWSAANPRFGSAHGMPGSSRALKMKASQLSMLSSAASENTFALREILDKSSKLRPKFEAFVKKRFALEALDLYDATSEYTEFARNNNNPASLKKKGLKIIADHIKPKNQAKTLVDLPYELRNSLIATTDFDAKTFLEVRKLAFNLLKGNFFNAFASENNIGDENAIWE